MNIIVVGAGIAGLSTAWSLTKAGHSVTILEQGSTIPNPLAASGDHHRIIRRAYRASTGYGRLITEAYDAWDELWADLGENHLDPRGFVCISREPGDEAENIATGWRRVAIRSSSTIRTRPSARWPFLEPGSFRYAYFSPEGGALHCRKIAAGLAAWLRGNGANVYENSKVVGDRYRGGPRRSRKRRDAPGRPRDRGRRRLGAEAVSRIRRRAEDLSHRARLCRSAGGSQGGLGEARRSSSMSAARPTATSFRPPAAPA